MNSLTHSLSVMALLLIFSSAKAQWKVQQSGVQSHLNAVDFIDSNLGLAVGDDGVVLRTTNGGQAWEMLDSLGVAPLNDVHWVNNSTAWATGKYGGLYVTYNKGDSWTIKSVGSFNSDLLSMSSVNDQVLWVTGTLGAIYYSIDGGDSWENKGRTSVEGYRNVQFLNDSTGFIVGFNGLIQKTIDTGRSWLREDGYNMNVFDVFFLSDSKGWLCGDDSLVLYTTDAGKTWVKGYIPTTESLQSIRFTDDLTGWVVGANGTIFKSKDGGKTWHASQTNLTSDHILSTDFEGGFGWAVGSNGLILKYTQPNSGIIPTETVSVSCRVYPNPVVETARIEFSGYDRVREIRLYNSGGQEMAPNLITQKSQTSFELDATNLTSGIYNVVARTSMDMVTRKIILIKN